MYSIDHITLEVADSAAATRFYVDALGLDPETSGVTVRTSDTPTSGFRGFALSLITAQPADVDALVQAATDAGATILKAPTKSFWGYGAAFTAPDGTVWQVASESKKNTGPASKKVTDVVLLLGVDDVKATKQFYVDRGLEVGKAFGGKYVEFAAPEGTVKLALYGRRAIGKQVGVTPEGSGSHRIAVASGAGDFTDPDGYAWEAA
ncbi:VOC family protein [Pseudactinotalea terrae]|uniref:VOC family protein n=1 Tax=Pseudactinotalea terrae TaxID=1743262 RepID=UPI0012E1902A|nr:VOC family protein [Pseudactinotalea terrae]